MDQAALTQHTVSLEQLSQRLNRRKEESLRRGVELRLPRLQQLFGLTQFETDALLICLALEVDLRYERLYAYLHDDVTKKRPTVDLILGLLAPTVEVRFAARS